MKGERMEQLEKLKEERKDRIPNAPEESVESILTPEPETMTEEPRETKKTEVAQTQRQHLTTKETGQFSLGTLSEQLAFGRTLIEQGMVSSSFENPSQVVVGIQWALGLNLNPITALRSMYVVNGRPSLWGDGPLMMVQRSGQMESIEEFFIDRDGKRISFEAGNIGSPVYGSVTRVKKVGDPIWQEDWFTLDDMKQAGLDKKKGDIWTKWTRMMMRYKPRAMALKTKFSSLLNGIDIAEYHSHFNPDMAGPSRAMIAESNKDQIDEQLRKDLGV